ncbi:MAG TPA: phosphopantetheine-binding protein [Ruminiclostridium sp.]|nr:phosphopantetheine-binding protein [Ruminiclostridium sp.]
MALIYDVVLNILKKYCSGPLNPDTDLFETGLNSFNAVNVLVDLEKYYKITFNDEELNLSKIRTAKNLEAFVKSKLEG